jgi:hypothetical protein
MRILRFVLVVLLIASANVSFAQTHQPKLTPQNSGTKELLIAVSPVNAKWFGRLGRRERLFSPRMAERPGRRVW